MPTDEEKAKAMRLARAIASDISLYNDEKIVKGIEQDNLFDAIKAEIEEGRDLYKSRVSNELYGMTNYYDRALVDILLRSRGARPLEALALMSEQVQHIVPADAAGRRLDQFLANLHADLSRSRLASLIDDGHVRVDGGPAKPARKLKGGEKIEVRVPDPVPATPEAQDLPLRILHEDADLVVLDKAAGVVVHPAAGVPDGTLVNALLFHIKDLGGIGGELRPGIVHRLDRDTSGCLVVAKHELALTRLQAAFKERVVDKRYLALVHDEAAQEEWTIDTPYGRHPTDRTRYTGRRPVGPSRRAVSHVRVLERFAGATLVEIELETGRTHQIRVHLSEAGHPLLADREYGGSKRDAKKKPNDPVRLAAEAIGRQALHARRLSFPHPRTGEILTIEAPLPADFEAALATLRASR